MSQLRLIVCVVIVFFFFFFFQAEDGIRDRTVTGVQTCALPIFPARSVGGDHDRRGGEVREAPRRGVRPPLGQSPAARSEVPDPDRRGGAHARDRKSTRLNSSHRTISYAVFCLKKKKKNEWRGL